MRILILSCNTGEGHNSCAKAIEEYCETQGEECVTVDALAFIARPVSAVVSWGHKWIYRHIPWLFRMGYRYAETHPQVLRERSPVYHLLNAGTKRMCRFIRDGGFDAVLCAHVFPAKMLTVAREKHDLKVAAGFLATDYTCSPGVQDSRLDRYFIPDGSLADDFLCEAVPREKMTGSGIPVRQEFCVFRDPKQAKALFGVAPDHKHLVIACGSMGCGPIEKLTGILSRTVGADCDLTVVCGTNRRLEKRMERRYAGAENVHIRGYVEDMSTLLDSADLYLTKPGGLSVSEAAVKQLPMVLVDAVAGCEEYNLNYFLNRGGARTGKTVDELARICASLLEDDAARAEMRERLRDEEKKDASKVIFEAVKEMTNDRSKE